MGRVWEVFNPGQNTELDWYLEGGGKAASELGLVAYYLLLPVAVVGGVGLRRRGITLIPLVAPSWWFDRYCHDLRTSPATGCRPTSPW